MRTKDEVGMASLESLVMVDQRFARQLPFLDQNVNARTRHDTGRLLTRTTSGGWQDGGE